MIKIKFNYKIINMKKLTEFQCRILIDALTNVVRDLDEEILINSDDSISELDQMRFDVDELRQMAKNNTLANYGKSELSELRTAGVGKELYSPLIGECIFIKITERGNILVFESSYADFLKKNGLNENEVQEFIMDVDSSMEGFKEFDANGYLLDLNLYKGKSDEVMLYLP